MTFPALVWEKHFPHRWAKITDSQAIAVSGLAPLRKLQSLWGLPSGKIVQATPYLGLSAVISDF